MTRALRRAVMGPLVAALGMLLLAGCTPDWAGQPQLIIEGREAVILQSRSIGAFHSIRLNEILMTGSVTGPIRVTLKPVEGDAEPAVEMRTNQDLFSHITCEVNNGWLEFAPADPGFYKFDELSLTILYPRAQLKEIRSTGSYAVSSESTLETHALTLYKQGIGAMNLRLSVSSLDATCGDAAQMILSGTATDVNIRTTGTAQVEAGTLQVDTASVNIRGAGNCSINATEKLNIQVVGAGTVEYAGEPEIWKVMFGPANVRQAGN